MGKHLKVLNKRDNRYIYLRNQFVILARNQSKQQNSFSFRQSQINKLSNFVVLLFFGNSANYNNARSDWPAFAPTQLVKYIYIHTTHGTEKKTFSMNFDVSIS